MSMEIDMSSWFEEAASLEEVMRRTLTRNIRVPSVILGFATSAPSRESGEGVHEDLIVIDPMTQSMMVIADWGNSEGLFGELGNKDGPLPASKASIEAMPVVKITEEEKEKECAICLGEYEVGGEAKEMPCNHRFHSGCIDKWLGIHGSCPICRYKMPSAEEEQGTKSRVQESNESTQDMQIDNN